MGWSLLALTGERYVLTAQHRSRPTAGIVCTMLGIRKKRTLIGVVTHLYHRAGRASRCGVPNRV